MTDGDSIRIKARQVREWMREQKCENLVLVTHGGVRIPLVSSLLSIRFGHIRHTQVNVRSDRW